MSTKPSTKANKDIVVPSMGESVTEATIARWLKNVGDSVSIDEPIVELETDKVTLEVGAPADGFLASQAVAEGGTVEVGAILGAIQEGASTAPQKAEASSNTPAPAAESTISQSTASAEISMSPAVKKLVQENHIDPQQIQGNGKDGRLTKGDVLDFIEKIKFQKVSQAPSSSGSQSLQQSRVSTLPRESGAREERVPMTRLRQRIAERLKEAQNTAAILTTFNEVDMTHVMDLRASIKDSFEKKHGVKLGFMSFFVKAAIVALKENPAVNAEIHDNELIFKNHYDIGVAVGTEQGLVVPVIRNADQLSFAGIEKTISDLGLKARDGQLTMQDMQGGTFTISNGGVYGSLMSTPILNPPQSGILGMHKIQKRPMVMPDGSIEARPMMYLALSYDHRIIDGKEAVTFLVRIKECIEDPQRILLDV